MVVCLHAWTAEHYLRNWFALDVLSCLPIGYVQYFVKGEDEQSSQFRAVKAFRLLKMTKMLRLARTYSGEYWCKNG